MGTGMAQESTCGTIRVVEPFDESLVTNEGCSVAVTETTAVNETDDDVIEIEKGGTVVVSVTVQNDNSADAEAKVTVDIDGDTRRRQVSVPAGEEVNAEFEAEPPLGEYTVTSAIEEATRA